MKVKQLLCGGGGGQATCCYTGPLGIDVAPGAPLAPAAAATTVQRAALG